MLRSQRRFAKGHATRLCSSNIEYNRLTGGRFYFGDRYLPVWPPGLRGKSVMNTFKHLVGVGALAFLFCAGASADTLELKDGRVIQGRYLGGTRVIVRFEVEGDVQTFRVSEVSVVRLDRRSGRDRDDNPPPDGRYEGAPPPDRNDAGGPPRN